jgi:hypothetical protein
MFEPQGEIPELDVTVDARENTYAFPFRLREFYPNGYGASVIKNQFSYGGLDDLFELAVLKGNEDGWEVCYTTPITDDTRGYLEWEEVVEIIDQIKQLPREV